MKWDDQLVLQLAAMTAAVCIVWAAVAMGRAALNSRAAEDKSSWILVALGLVLAGGMVGVGFAIANNTYYFTGYGY